MQILLLFCNLVPLVDGSWDQLLSGHRDASRQLSSCGDRGEKTFLWDE